MVQSLRLKVVVKASSASEFGFDSAAKTSEARKKNARMVVNGFLIFKYNESFAKRIEYGEM
jgi:hypothetical protein